MLHPGVLCVISGPGLADVPAAALLMLYCRSLGSLPDKFSSGLFVNIERKKKKDNVKKILKKRQIFVLDSSKSF